MNETNCDMVPLTALENFVCASENSNAEVDGKPDDKSISDNEDNKMLDECEGISKLISCHSENIDSDNVKNPNKTMKDESMEVEGENIALVNNINSHNTVEKLIETNSFPGDLNGDKDKIVPSLEINNSDDTPSDNDIFTLKLDTSIDDDSLLGDVSKDNGPQSIEDKSISILKSNSENIDRLELSEDDENYKDLLNESEFSNKEQDEMAESISSDNEMETSEKDIETNNSITNKDSEEIDEEGSDQDLQDSSNNKNNSDTLNFQSSLSNILSNNSSISITPKNVSDTLLNNKDSLCNNESIFDNSLSYTSSLSSSISFSTTSLKTFVAADTSGNNIEESTLCRSTPGIESPDTLNPSSIISGNSDTKGELNSESLELDNYSSNSQSEEVCPPININIENEYQEDTPQQSEIDFQDGDINENNSGSDNEGNSGNQESKVTGGTGETSANEVFSWETVICIFCDSLVTDQEPKLLPCLHSACNKCLTREASESVENKDEEIVAMDPLIHCPHCKKGFSQASVIDNMFIIEVADASEKKGDSEEIFICTSCSDEATASGLCTDCSEWLCEACIQAHKRVKVTKDHTIKAKAEIGSEPGGSKSTANRFFYCSVHSKERLNLYCVTCDQLTCRDCQLIEHREHKYKFDEEMATNTKETLLHYLSDIRKKRSYIENAKQLVNERRSQLLKKEESVQSDINRLVDTFTDIIRQRGVALIDFLKEICTTKQEQLDKKSEVLLHLGSQADHCITIVDSVLNSSSDMALLYAKKLLMDQVLKVDKDSPDKSLFDRFKAKLNSGDDISLRISSESRNIGKALKDVGYLLVDNRVYPHNASADGAPPSSGTSKNRPSQQPSPVQPSPSPVQPSPSPQPLSNQSLQQPTNQTTTISATDSTTTTYTTSVSSVHALTPSPVLTNQQPVMQQSTVQHMQPPQPQLQHMQHHHPPPPPPPPPQAPQPPTLTPMHSHIQHQQHAQHMMQNPNLHKFHNFVPGQAGTINPPSLVRIQGKQGTVTVHGAMSGPHMAPGFAPRMATLGAVRSNEVVSVSSSTHPLQESSHLRGLLGSGGTYKVNAYTHMPRMQHPAQHQQQQHQQQQHQQQQQQRMMDQQANRRTTMQYGQPLNHQSAAMAMAAGMATNPLTMMSMTAGLTNPSAISITPLSQHQQQSQTKNPHQSSTLPGILRTSLSQPPLMQKSSGDSRSAQQPSPHSNSNQQQLLIQQPKKDNSSSSSKKESISPSPSWHIPQMNEALRNLATSTILSNLVSGNTSTSISLKDITQPSFSSQNNLQQTLQQQPPNSSSNSSSPMVSIPSDVLDNSFKIILGSNSVSKSTTSSTISNLSSSITTSATDSINSAALQTLANFPFFRPILPKGKGKEGENGLAETAKDSRHPLSLMASLLSDSKDESSSEAVDSSSNSPNLKDKPSVKSRTVKSSKTVVPSLSITAQPEVSGGNKFPWKKDPADPNDDWCAVCWDGGDLICCDFCPKVFHTYCHIPYLTHLPRPNDKWQCMICKDLENIAIDNQDVGQKRHLAMGQRELKVAQRILLELYCNYEPSQPFRELVDRELTEYYEIIKHPMALEIIKKKLKPDSIDHYKYIDDFIKDIKLIFKNCYAFNPKDTEIYQSAKILEDFFGVLLKKWLPDYNVSDSEDSTEREAKRRKKDNNLPTLHIF